MSQGGATGPFASLYASALREYLDAPREEPLRAAYELGREAIGRGVSVLELAAAHQDALDVLVSAAVHEPDAEGVVRLVRAAGDFFLESLASHEMLQRGFDDARDTLRRHRRATELSRRLSTFLADASLAHDVSGSLQEILTLVSEEARELLDAECCLATASPGGVPRTVVAASHRRPDAGWRALVRWLDVPAVQALIARHGGAMRLDGEELVRLGPRRDATGDHPHRGWLGVSLTALDGSQIGALQLFDKVHGHFTADDQAALLHLAQMASAAVERAWLYGEDR